MRDYRDAKAMAQTLRESLATKSFNVSHSESLELVSRMFGVADWNTLSAALTNGSAPRVAEREQVPWLYPAVPIRDFIAFPGEVFPLFVGREKSMRALDRAFEGRREIALVLQREGGTDEPGLADVHSVGLLAKLLELFPTPDNTMKVLVQAHGRVMIRRFSSETPAYEAEIAYINEGRIPGASRVVQKVLARFDAYTRARGIEVGRYFGPRDESRDPGRLADSIAMYLKLTLPEKQDLLSTLDPVARLEKLDARMTGDTLETSS